MAETKQFETNMRGAIWTETRVTTEYNAKTDKNEIVSAAFSGKIMVHGEEFKIKLWPVVSNNAKAPAYRMKLYETSSANASKEA